MEESRRELFELAAVQWPPGARVSLWCLEFLRSPKITTP